MKKFILRTDNRISIEERAIEHIKSLDHLLEWTITIERHKLKKTDRQRKFFHFLISIFAAETGYTKEEMKQAIKENCFGTIPVSIGGKSFDVLKSSESASRDEYSDLIETCYRLAAESGIDLPEALYLD